MKRLHSILVYDKSYRLNSDIWNHITVPLYNKIHNGIFIGIFSGGIFNRRIISGKLEEVLSK